MRGGTLKCRLFSFYTLSSRLDQFVAQAVVRWHPGCGGGRGWLQWGIEAVAAYRAIDLTPKETVSLVERLWLFPQVAGSNLLSGRTPAAQELLRCALHYIVGESFVRVHTETQTLPAEAAGWASSVADLIAALYELPAHIIQMVRSSAIEHGFRLPDSIDLQDRRMLVDAVEARIGLEHLIETGKWPTVKGTSLTPSEARNAVEFAIELARNPGSRSGADIARRMLSYDFNQDACDGFELECSEFGLIHVPRADSPHRISTRDRMIALLEDHFRHVKPSSLPERRPDESMDGWAERVVTGWNAIPGEVRAARHAAQKHVAAAAHILVAIGDDRAISAIWNWLNGGAEEASELFSDVLFETYGYEIVQPGRRKDLQLALTHFFKEASPPTSPARRDTIEVLRPVKGKCEACGGRLLGFFDLLMANLKIERLTSAHRVAISFCPECCEQSGGTFNSIQTFTANDPDTDAWPAEQAKELSWQLPARCFGMTSTKPRDVEVGGWLGGLPQWEQYPAWPRCDHCCNRMLFAGQIWYYHTYYCFVCLDCMRSNVHTQYD
jgi:hypothetical protein